MVDHQQDLAHRHGDLRGFQIDHLTGGLILRLQAILVDLGHAEEVPEQRLVGAQQATAAKVEGEGTGLLGVSIPHTYFLLRSQHIWFFFRLCTTKFVTH